MKYEKLKNIESSYKKFYNSECIMGTFTYDQEWFLITVKLKNSEKIFLVPIEIEDIDSYVNSKNDGIDDFHIKNKCYELKHTAISWDRVRCEREQVLNKICELYKKFYSAKHVEIRIADDKNCLIVTIELDGEFKICELPDYLLSKGISCVSLEDVQKHIEKENKNYG